MLDSPQPWIELQPSYPSARTTPAAETDIVRAQFAFIVTPKPFSERMSMKWGWNAGAAFEEAVGRMRQCVLALHPRNYQVLAINGGLQKTIALRCRCFPEMQTLSLCLVAGIYGQTADLARTNALDFYHELAASLPYDWVFTPIGSQDQFRVYSGADLLQNHTEDQSIVEIGRYESMLNNAQSSQYLLGEWQVSTYANELIWRALANSSVPVLLSILLQPTLLSGVELNILQQQTRSEQESQRQAHSLTQQREMDWAANLPEKRLRTWCFPYLLQVHLVSSQRVPPFIQRVVGSTLTYSADMDSSQPGYLAAYAHENQTFWKESLLTLMPIFGISGGSKPYQRLRLLASPQEACAVMQLPYPNEYGLPGVSFISEVS